MPTGQANRLMPSLRRVVLARQSAARTDGELLGAFVADRDADAFAELVRRHGPMVLGVCRRVVNDHATADDAFQATFLVLARRAAAVRPREQVGSWLYGVAYRTALKARMVLARRRSREKQVDVMPEPTAPTSSTALWADLQPVIDEELARLPERLRLPVVLCDLEGRPQREVAKHLNVPPATLATRLASARRTLAARLTRRGVTLSGGALAGLLGAHASASAVPHTLASGVVRAAEAGATGAAVQSLVSARAVQLSEGVMRMMMLAKLKAVAVLAVTALALTTGLGLGLMPAAAGDGNEPAPAQEEKAAAKPAPVAQPATINTHIAARLKDQGRPEPADDATFLRRLCLDVRGTLPTDVEMWFFVSDTDDDKRAKVVDWMTDDDAAKLALAKKLGVPPERIRLLRAKPSADGQFVELTLVDAGVPGKRHLLAFTPDGNKLVAELRDFAVKDGQLLAAVGEKDTVWSNRVVLPVKEFADAQKLGRLRWAQLAAAGDDKSGDLFRYKLIDPTTADRDVLWAWLAAGDDRPYDKLVEQYLLDLAVVGDSDAEFLKRVLADARGGAPTALELKYFTEDKDPKKREKLLDTLLKDPAVAKKLGDAWKKKMLAPAQGSAMRSGKYFYYVLPDEKGKSELRFPKAAPNPPVPPVRPKPPVPPVQPKPPTPPVPPTAKGPAPQTDKLEKLVSELIAARKSDDAILEAVTLATLGRLPTDTEKKLALAVGKTADRKATWLAVARALAAVEDAKKPEGKFKFKVDPYDPSVPPTPPPPTPPKR
jgi:RNA polymerase sigma factor (sigma-70 family)